MLFAQAERTVVPWPEFIAPMEKLSVGYPCVKSAFPKRYRSVS